MKVELPKYFDTFDKKIIEFFNILFAIFCIFYKFTMSTVCDCLFVRLHFILYTNMSIIFI